MTARTLKRARVLAPGAGGELIPYDFTSPALLTASQRQVLNEGFEVFAAQLAVQLTAKTRMVVSGEYDAFTLKPLGALAAAADGASGFVLCAVDGVQSRLVYEVPTAEALLWTSRMVGGTGRMPAARRALTAIERALLWRMADEHLAELKLALGDLIPGVAVIAYGADLSADVAPPDELMLVAAIRLRRGDDVVPVRVAIPAAPVLAAFGHGVGAQTADAATPLLEQHVAASPVEISVRFEPTRVGPQVVLGLVAGDLIPLSHERHQPLAMTLDGDPIVRVSVGANGARLACVVIDS